MKKFMKSLALIAVAAMGLTACENSFDAQNVVEKKTYEISVDTEATRSVFGEKEDGVYPTLWSGNEVVKVSLAEADVQDATLDAQKGTLTVELAANATGTLYAVTPYNTTTNYSIGGFGKVNSTYHDFYVTIPVEQTPLANSVDESAQLLFAECEVGSSMSMVFKHIAAYGKMTIKNFAHEIKQVVIVAPVEFVGASAYYYYSGDKENTIANLKDNTLTLNAENVQNNVFWFTCAPIGDLTSNMTLVVTDSEGNTYTKELAAAGKLAFEQGKVSNFSVDMAGIEKDEAAEIGGDYVLMVKHSNKFYALSSENATSSNRRKAVIISGYTAGDATVTTNDENLIWNVTETVGGCYIMQDGKYLYGTNNQNYAQVGTTKDVISMVANADGTYQMLSSNNTTDPRNLALNSGVGSGEFSFYKVSTTTGSSSSSYADDIILVPATFVATPEMSVNAQPSTVSADGGNVTVALTLKNLTADDITVTPSASWITNATVNGSNLTFTVAANDVEQERTATITLASSGLTATVNVKQEAKVVAPDPGEGETALGSAYSYDVTAKTWTSWDAGAKCGAVTWIPSKVSVNGSPTVGNKDGSGRGQQFGAANTNQIKTMTMTAKDYSGGVKSVDVKACAKSGNTVTISVTVGGVTMTSTNNSKTISGSNSASIMTANFTSDTVLTGDIVITYTLKTAGALYVSGFAINN